MKGSLSGLGDGMKTLLKNGQVVNVFTGEVERVNVLMEDGIIIGVGDYYSDADADVCEDVSGKILCPGFIDGHIHIESTMLTPTELARAVLPHGTVSVIADPHEIANVCGREGIAYMLEASKGLPLCVYVSLPSCVPATPFDESGAVLNAKDLKDFYIYDRVVGLGEMMNFPGVLASDEDVMRKIYDARRLRRSVDGHAPGLSGKALDAYISAGIGSDHECTTAEEAIEKIRKGQTVMIRQGTAARNLDALLPLFDEPYCHRCILVTDDLHPADIMSEGHIDNIIRKAAAKGKSAITGIQMATIGAARYFGLGHVGAIAPGYRADILVLDDLDSVDVRDVYSSGVKVVDNKTVLNFEAPKVNEYLEERVRSSFHLPPLRAMDFRIEEKTNKCRVIGVLGGGLLTEEKIMDIVWGETGGVDTERDILKVAVIERYNNTGHIGLGFINGIGLKKGAIASSVSHDSHNIIVIGTNDPDMAIAANRIREVGGNVVVCDGKVISEMSLSIGGLMSDASAAEVARQNKAVREAVKELGVCEGVEPFMNMAFVSLPVIPSLKISTCGLIDVNKQEKVPLCV